MECKRTGEFAHSESTQYESGETFNGEVRTPPTPGDAIKASPWDNGRRFRPTLAFFSPASAEGRPGSRLRGVIEIYLFLASLIFYFLTRSIWFHSPWK